MAKKTPKRKHRTIALKGMTPSEIEAWRAQEIRERAREAKARDEEKRAAGKPGRPKGKKRLFREATGNQRHDEIKAQREERRRRALRGDARSGAYARIEKGKPVIRKTRRGGVEKTLYRLRGTSGWQGAVDALNALPKGTSAYVQVGAGYGVEAPWVGSRLTSPADAAGWLEGIGLKYRAKIFSGRKPDELFIEFVALRKVGTRGERKAAVEGRKASRGRSGKTSRGAVGGKSNAKASAGAAKGKRGRSGKKSRR